MAIKNEEELRLVKRDDSVRKLTDEIESLATVNDSQYSFDTKQREEAFEKNLCSTDAEYHRFLEYRKAWFERAKHMKAGDFPLAVCCELVSTCNLNCPMCYTITEEFQAQTIGSVRIMPWDIVKNIIDESSALGVYSILFSWRGESTMYKSKGSDGNLYTIADVFRYARSKGILEITCLTNGSLISGKLAETLIDADPSWLSFSVDGLKEVYNKIRTPVNKKHLSNYNAFDIVVGNIKQLVLLRDKKGKTRPQIRCNTIYPPISPNPKAYYEFMKDIGVDWVTVNELLDFREDEIPDEEIIKNWACQYPFQRIVISSNGTILPCTGAHDEYDELVLGRYKGTAPKEVLRNSEKLVLEYPEVNIEEAWFSEKMQKIREIHKSGNRCKIKSCRNCRHGSKKHGVEWIPEDWDMENMEWKGGRWME